MYGLAALTVGVSSIPLLFILWRVLKAPIRIPLLFSRTDVRSRRRELIGPEDDDPHLHSGWR